MEKDRNAAQAGQELFIDTAEGLREYLRGCARRALKEIFEEEIRSLCGERYHPAEGDYRRAGAAPSYVINDARREPMDRPRVRRVKKDGGTEDVAFKSWKLAQSPDEWDAAMMRGGIWKGEFGREFGTPMGYSKHQAQELEDFVDVLVLHPVGEERREPFLRDWPGSAKFGGADLTPKN